MKATADLNDTLREEGDEGVRRRNDRAQRFKPGNGQAQGAASGLDEWDAGDDPGAIPPRQWLLGNQFCRGFISSLVAAGGVGKSALRLLQFISMALGVALCGQFVFRRCRVLLISLEDDRDELHRRIKAVLKFFNIERDRLKGWLFCATPAGSKLAELDGKQRRAGQLDRQIREAIARRKPDIVAFDPFAKLHALNENDSGDMNFVCEILVKLAAEMKIAVDIPHHVHKGLITPGDADAGRGSSGIRDAGRLIYTLTPMTEVEARAFGIDVAERLSFIRLDSAKVNIAPRSGAAVWFRLVGMPIDNATEEYPSGDVIQVAQPWRPPETWAGLDNWTLNNILDDIDAGLPNGERYSDASAAKERAAWPVVLRRASQKTETQAREIIRVWVKNGTLESVPYYSAASRKESSGLRVNAAKRPGTETFA